MVDTAALGDLVVDTAVDSQLVAHALAQET